MNRSACKSCGKAIYWITTPGKDGGLVRIPLDAVAPVYAITDVDGEPVLGARAENAYVSHFSTCPNASKHSKRGAAREA
ncbi:MAG: hypothetical protein H6832_14895 [Planctomycetes bacterium]|nr:hypothetical protein [Planctomycetota bacterium]